MEGRLGLGWISERVCRVRGLGGDMRNGIEVCVGFKGRIVIII